MTELSRQVLADLLFEHERKVGFRDMRAHCMCGWAGPEGGDRGADHRAHVVEVIYEVAHRG